MNATFIMTAQGAMALGGVIWGTSASIAGVNPTLIAGALLLATSLILAIPLSINFFAVATVTPPAVSVKMPSVRASSLIPSRISSSLTMAAEPPDLLTTSLLKIH